MKKFKIKNGCEFMSFKDDFIPIIPVPILGVENELGRVEIPIGIFFLNIKILFTFQFAKKGRILGNR